MIELKGTLQRLTFKGEGENNDVVGTITIKCYPNDIESGRLSQLAGKEVDISISSRQIPLPLRTSEEQPARVVGGGD